MYANFSKAVVQCVKRGGCCFETVYYKARTGRIELSKRSEALSRSWTIGDPSVAQEKRSSLQRKGESIAKSMHEISPSQIPSPCQSFQTGTIPTVQCPLTCFTHEHARDQVVITLTTLPLPFSSSSSQSTRRLSCASTK